MWKYSSESRVLSFYRFLLTERHCLQNKIYSRRLVTKCLHANQTVINFKRNCLNSQYFWLQKYILILFSTCIQ